jgi:hypothetical protein
MLLLFVITVIVFIAYFIGFAFNIIGDFIHLLLVVAGLLILWGIVLFFYKKKD